MKERIWRGKENFTRITNVLIKILQNVKEKSAVIKSEQML